MAGEGQHRIGHRKLAGREFGRIGTVELRRRVVGRVEAVGGNLGEVTGGLRGLRLRLAVARPKRGEIAAAVEGEHAGAILLARHVLAEPGLGQFLQLLAERRKLGGRGFRGRFRGFCGLRAALAGGLGRDGDGLPEQKLEIGFGKRPAGERQHHGRRGGGQQEFAHRRNSLKYPEINSSTVRIVPPGRISGCYPYVVTSALLVQGRNDFFCTRRNSRLRHRRRHGTRVGEAR